MTCVVDMAGARSGHVDEPCRRGLPHRRDHFTGCDRNALHLHRSMTRWRVSMRIYSSLALTCALVAGFTAAALSAEYMEKNERQKARAYSPSVITEGGRIVWLAGQTALQDDHGKDLAGNFEGQARQIFHLIDQTLNKAGGGVANLVTMTVFINDPRNGDRLTEIRKEIFPDGNYPGSALITVSNFAVPGMLIEIQGIAVIGDRCAKPEPCTPTWPAR
jgi:2-iminobutanoate/2-iminopropanoate deaminase